MREIVNRLHENRQVQLAKEILESNGYKVEKKRMNEATTPDIGCDEVLNNAEAREHFQRIVDNPDNYAEGEVEIAGILLDIVKRDKHAVYFSDLFPVDDYEEEVEILSTGNDYLYKGKIYIDEDEYSGYIDGNRDGVMNFLLTNQNI